MQYIIRILINCKNMQIIIIINNNKLNKINKGIKYIYMLYLEFE